MCCCLECLQERCTLAVISHFLIFPGSDLWTECVQPPANTSVQVVRAGDNKQVMTRQVEQQRRDGDVARWNAAQTKAELYSYRGGCKRTARACLLDTYSKFWLLAWLACQHTAPRQR